MPLEKRCPVKPLCVLPDCGVLPDTIPQNASRSGSGTSRFSDYANGTLFTSVFRHHFISLYDYFFPGFASAGCDCAGLRYKPTQTNDAEWRSVPAGPSTAPYHHAKRRGWGRSGLLQSRLRWFLDYSLPVVYVWGKTFTYTLTLLCHKIKSLLFFLIKWLNIACVFVPCSEALEKTNENAKSFSYFILWGCHYYFSHRLRMTPHK